MELATKVQILDKAVGISICNNVLGKAEIQPLFPSYGEIVRQIGLFSLDMETSIKDEKLWIQTIFTPLKNWPCDTSYLFWGDE